MEAKLRIVVIGAGIIGLSTACNIVELIPEAEVSVTAESFSPDTTSDVAAGIWYPHRLGGTPTERILDWGRATWDHLSSLATSATAGEAGTFFVSGRVLFNERRQEPFWKDVVVGYRSLGDDELARYGGRYASGAFFTSVLCDSTRYLPWLAARFAASGGRMRRRAVASLAELADADADVVVNCSGNGARRLCADGALTPIRGHVVRARAPWLKQFVIAPDDCLHVLCSTDVVVLGFTDRRDDERTPRPADRERIVRGCLRLEPSLVRATELRDQLAFRPVRDVVRLEVEYGAVGATDVPVVHNYGHGGAGVTTHWGCAIEAANLVRQLVQPSAKI